LFDLAVVIAPDGGLAAAGRPDRSLTGVELAELVRGQGGAGLDVRVLAAPGEHNLPTVVAMAQDLGRDVLIAPSGSELRHLPPVAEPGSVEPLPVPVHLGTGAPVDWIVVQPGDQATPRRSWFELSSGLVVPRTGTVLLPVPGGGFAFATREDFIRRRAAVAALRPGHPGLSTVAIGVRAGHFVLGDYNGESTHRDAHDLAMALTRLPLHRVELRMWLTWPEPAEEVRRLRRGLAELAEYTATTVWAPEPGGRVVILDGCRDLAVTGPDMSPGRWERYGATNSRAFQTDVDGRLVPAGGVAATSHPGVPVVSVPLEREREFAPHYPALVARRDRDERWRSPGGAFHADVAVLADGRLALRYTDDSLLAIGERQWRDVLSRAGWHGADVVLLAPVPPERSNGVRRHAQILADYLRCPITLAQEPGAGTPHRVRPAAPPALPPYPEAAVRNAVATLNPHDPRQAARLTALALAVAEHARSAHRLADAGDADRMSLVGEHLESIRRVASLTEPWAAGPERDRAPRDRP
jgi:hypothetical protein